MRNASAWTNAQMPRMPSPPRYKLPAVNRPGSAFPTGPRDYRRTRKNTYFYGGPGPAPAGFVIGSTSLSEWYWYWASRVVLDPLQDPRAGPFNGGTNWLYQVSELGTYTRQAGSAVIDFFYKTQYPYLAVRIQTFRFHLSADTLKQRHDRQQLVALMGQFDVVDVYEGDYINDRTGASAIKLVKKTLGLQQKPDPISSGNVFMVRPEI